MEARVLTTSLNQINTTTKKGLALSPFSFIKGGTRILHKTQIDLELSLIEQGKINYTAKTHRNNSSAEFNVLTKCHERFESEIIRRLRELIDGKPSPHNITHAGIKLILEITPSIVSALTLRLVLASIDQPIPLTQLAFQVANELIQQHKYSFLVTESEIQKHRFDIKIDYQYSRNDTLAKRVDMLIADECLTPPNLTQADKTRLGIGLLYLIKNIGLIDINTTTIGAGRKQLQVKASQPLVKYMSDHNEKHSLLHPLRQPMIEAPKPWKSLYKSGGYHTISSNFVRGANTIQMRALKESNLEDVFTAVNKLQGVEWRIDSQMLDIIKTLTVECPDMCKSTSFMEQKSMVEPYPKTGTEKEQAQWRFESFLIVTQNQSNLSRKTRFLKTLSIADAFKDYPTIYFPHNIDSRGRTYPIPTLLNPQGDDVSKALLLLQPEKVTGDGGRWLKINIANLFGMDKLSMYARIDWFDRHLDELMDDPMDGCRFWTKGDKPLPLLQACLDYKNYLVTGMSSVVCRVDATCSAIQIIAAMTRNPELATLTNLSNDASIRRDFYQAVADNLDTEVISEADHPKVARRWIGKISRKLIKPSVMTSPFSVSPRGIQRQLIEYVKAHSTPTKPFIQHDDKVVVTCCTYLQKKLTHTLIKKYPQLKLVMDFMRSNTRKLTLEGKSPQWTLPNGLTYVQHDIDYDSVRVEFRYKDVRHRVRVRDSLDEHTINARRQSNSVTPNLIHSLDGCHIHMTANHCDFEITPIHDSVGSHANNMSNLQRITREQFVSLHEQFNINSIFEGELDINIGDFDINEVMSNPYFFS